MIGDIIFHVLCLSFSALCAWSAIVSQGPARLVSILTGAVFLLAIAALWFLRWRSNRADYVTRHGLRIRRGRINRPTKIEVEIWTTVLLKHWQEHHPIDKVLGALKDHFVVFIDARKWSLWGRLVSGASTHRMAAIGLSKLPNGDPDYDHVRELFLHELSHKAVSPFLPWDEATHHDHFARTGLNAL